MAHTTWVAYMADWVLVSFLSALTGFVLSYCTIDASDHRRLDELAELDEPGAHLLPAAPIVEEEGLVVTDFSDEEEDDETYDW